MKKRWLSLALAGVVAVSAALTGCGGFSGGDGGKKADGEKVFRISISSDIPDLDPALVSDNQSALLANQVFQSLTYVQKDGTAGLDAAEKVEHSDDFVTWTFTLKDGLKFSNGDEIKAEDYKYSWLRTLNPETASGQANRLYFIKGAQAYNEGKGKAEEVGIEAKDDKTLVVTLEKGNAFFDEAVAYPVYSVVDKKVIEANGKEWFNKPETYIGSGAYKLESYDLGKEIVLKKNDNYINAKDVQIDTVKIAIIEDENTVYEKFKAKDLDFVGSPAHSVPTDKMDEAKGLPEYKQFPNTQIYWYKVNTKDPIMGNVHMRKALALAIDRQNIIDNVAKGNQIPATGIIPQFKSEYFKDNDVEEAKKELELGMKELGINKPEDVTVQVKYNTNEGHQKIAQAVQENWKKNLGINAEISNEEWKVYLDTLKEGNYQIGRLGWVADFTDPADFLNMYMYEDGEDNMTYWHSDEFNAKIGEANKHFDDLNKRDALLKEAEAIIMADMPAIPVYFGTVNTVIQDTVDQLNITLLGNLYIKDVKLK
ncbi:MAG: peptide ABC transporter substrate-binding protein [Eubacteriales bacterium]|nr:peptide ABC transporter substrate-binding protein [Eubacteriales bacterium]